MHPSSGSIVIILLLLAFDAKNKTATGLTLQQTCCTLQFGSDHGTKSKRQEACRCQRHQRQQCGQESAETCGYFQSNNCGEGFRRQPQKKSRCSTGRVRCCGSSQPRQGTHVLVLLYWVGYYALIFRLRGCNPLQVAADVFVIGDGDCGQFGLGEDVVEAPRPLPTAASNQQVRLYITAKFTLHSCLQGTASEQSKWLCRHYKWQLVACTPSFLHQTTQSTPPGSTMKEPWGATLVCTHIAMFAKPSGSQISLELPSHSTSWASREV